MKRFYLLLFFVICILIIIITVLYRNWIIISISNYEDRGNFGDMFGALNALFSGFAFAGVIITILMQKEELTLTRNELQKSSVAQDKSQKALNDQLASMQLSTKIDSLNQYIKLLDPKKDIDKFNFANKIIKETTEKLFYLEENDNITKPFLKFSHNVRTSRPPSSILIEYDFILINSGASLIELDCELPKEVKKVDEKVRSVKTNEGLRFFAASNQFDFKIPIRYKGAIVQNEWIQFLNLKLEGNKVNIWVSDPELIRRFNQ